MRQKPELTEYERLQRLSPRLIAITVVTALLVLCGWQWDIPLLRQFGTGLPAMNPVSALLFILASFSFLILASPSRSPLLDGLGYFLAAAVLAFAIVRLTGYFVPVLGRVDQFLYSDRLSEDSAGGFPGKMAFNTALCFLCCATGLFLLRRSRPMNRAIHPLALMIGCFALLSVLGYIYRVREFHGFLKYLPMAMNTACCFLLVALAFLFATPDRGLMKDLTGPGAGSVTARRLTAFAFVAPVVLGWLRLWGGRTGAFTTEFGVSLLVLSIIICFVFVIWYNGRLLNRREATERNAREALQANERTFGMLIASIRDYAIVMVDPDGRIKSWNSGAQAIKGYTAEEVIGQPISLFYTPEELERNEPAYNLYMAERNGSFRSEGWRVRKNGTRFWGDILFTALYDANHRLQGFAKITRDMSEQKKANDVIRSQARLMEDISDAIITTDPGFRIVNWNKATEKLFGYSLAEAQDHDMGELLRNPQEQSLRQAIRELLGENGYWHGEVTYYTKKRIPLNVIVSVSATRDEQNMMTGFVIVCRDITERLKAEQRLVKFNEELTRQVEEKTAEVRDVFERVTDAFMAYDRSGTVIYMNSRARQLMGRVGVTDNGQNIFGEFPVAVQSPFGQHFQHALETQQEQHFEMWSQVLSLWLETHMYPSPNGISQFFRDITEERVVREQLSQSHAEMRELASHLQDVREEERAEMAREIHDELGQQLTGLKMDMAWVEEEFEKLGLQPQRERVIDALRLLDHTIMTVRKIAPELRPGILDDLGLVAAVEWLAEEFEKRSGVQTTFRAGMPGRRYPSQMSIGLFRICQEALTNVARHSGARHVGIFLGYDEDRIVLRVKDDGRGLPPQREEGRKTLGLLGMKERALMMGGTLEVSSEAGKGLSLTVSVPMASGEKI
ncbi:MAG TPA: PAS domain S-box protein [Puia sp.]|nr:PAS domain S-box protein [Puia sp.]